MARKVRKITKSIDEHWTSPVSFDSRSFSMLIGGLLDELGYKYETDQGEKMYSKMYHFMPMPFRFAFVHKFRVTEPSKFNLDLYDTQPNHGGKMYYIEIYDIGENNHDTILELLKKVVDKAPRPPWKFTSVQRVQYGALMPEFRKAKKAWQQWGFYTGKIKNIPEKLPENDQKAGVGPEHD